MLRTLSGDRSSASTRVLVVDDDVDVSLTLAALLEDLGCEVSVVHEGADALARARAFRPALVCRWLARPATGFDWVSVVAPSGSHGKYRLASRIETYRHCRSFCF